jgi:hypothetical protein
LLTTVAPQQFVEALVEPDGRHFLVFGSTIKPKGSIVEPTTNALRKRAKLLRNKNVIKSFYIYLISISYIGFLLMSWVRL